MSFVSARLTKKRPFVPPAWAEKPRTLDVIGALAGQSLLLVGLRGGTGEGN
jgi:hypothetical protein